MRRNNPPSFGHAHYIIEGKRFPSMHAVWCYAKVVHKFTGPENVFKKRLHEGKQTWQELLKPIDETISNRVKDYRREEKEKMHKLCEELDRRKKELEDKSGL